MGIRSSLAIVILLILLAIVASMNANPGHVRDLFIKAIYKEGLEPYAPIRGSTGQFASTLALRQGWVTGYQAPLFFHLLTLTSNTSTGTSALATARALLALDACQDGILSLEICEVDPVIQLLGQGAATMINALDYAAPSQRQGRNSKLFYGTSIRTVRACAEI